MCSLITVHLPVKDENLSNPGKVNKSRKILENTILKLPQKYDNIIIIVVLF